MSAPSITAAQRRKVFALCRELGWGDDMRHEMLAQWIGKSSLAADAEHPITRAELITVLRNLRAAVAQVQRGRAAAKRRRRRIWPADRPTPEQLHTIARLRVQVFGANEIAWRGRLRTLKLPESEQWFSPADATKLIADLHRLVLSGWHPAVTCSS